MLKLLVGRGGWYQETFLVSCSQATNDPGAGNGAVCDRDEIL